jgi:hypothetical protein
MGSWVSADRHERFRTFWVLTVCELVTPRRGPKANSAVAQRNRDAQLTREIVRLRRQFDPDGVSEGMARSAEYRLGGSYSPWNGALIDIGGTRLETRNALAGTHTIAHHPNVGFEQTFWNRRIAIRFGLEETSPTAGPSFKHAPFSVDLAYVDNMARSRVGELFGINSRSILMTVTIDYRSLLRSL